MQAGGMTTYPEVAEKTFEIILSGNVIVCTHHAQEDALAEAPGTDEEQVIGLILQQRQVHRLVHIILVLFNDIHKVGHTVRYSFNFFHIHHNCRDKCNNTTKIGKVPGNRGAGMPDFSGLIKEYGVRSFPCLSVTL